MTQNVQECCVKFDWRFIADLQHADGIEFTLGKCASCGANLVNLWSDAVQESQDYVIVDDDFVTRVMLLEGTDLKQFLREWLNAD